MTEFERDIPVLDHWLATWRRVAVRLTSLLGLLLFGLVVGLVVMNVLGIIPSGSEGSPNDPPASAAALIGADMPDESVHAAGAIGLLAIGVTSLVRLILRPERSGAALQVLAVSTAWVVSVPLVGDPNNVGGQAGPVDPIFLAVALPSIAAGLLAVPWRLQKTTATGDRRFLVLAAIAVLPASWYAIDQALMQRNTFPPTADPHHNAHWWVMAIMALAVVLAVASAGLSSDGRAWVVLAGLAGVAFGLASLLAPSSASAVRWPWGVATIAWSAVTLALLGRRFATRADHYKLRRA